MDSANKTIRASELKRGMRIQGITKFDSKYSCLDSESLRFLQRRFKGATAAVVRDSREKSISMQDLRLFDEVARITDLPPGAASGEMGPDLGKALEEEGFFEITVSLPPPGQEDPGEEPPQEVTHGPSLPAVSSDPKHVARVAEATALLDKVELAAEQREQSCDRVEEMIDRGRSGAFSSKGAATAVADILAKGTSTAMKAIAGLKASDQTYAHCVDMSVIFAETYADLLADTGQQVTQEISRSTMLAGFMHDIGKSKIPREILDSTKAFPPDSKEMRIIRQHPDYGAQILSDLGMDNATINVAHFHHVKKDVTLPTSYPAASYDDVQPLTRLAAIVDVYQALIGKRSYKPNWVPGKAVELLMKLRGTEFDEHALGHFLRSIGIYPVGSLVRLSSQELAFVIKSEREALERPVIVVVENPQGELLTHHQLFDLMIERDLSILEVVDHFKHYDQSPDQAYQIFRSINLG